jgi:MarR family 2-MHQ and catechol resistance regulon transcriptional repressor
MSSTIATALRNKPNELTKARLSKLLQEESLRVTAWRNLAATYKTVYFHVNSDLRKYGLTPPQYTVLRSLGKSITGTLSMSDIAKQMIVTFANVTTVVDNLERRNLVRRIRNADDRRVVKVELTSRGASLFRKINASHAREVEKLMESLTENELRSLISTTTKIKNAITQKQTLEEEERGKR